MEDKKITSNQFKGIMKMIIALIRNDTPKEGKRSITECLMYCSNP